MQIYKNEIKDGLGEDIKANASIIFASTPKIVTEDAEQIRECYASSDLMANIGDQKDLAPIQSILVSTGWNANSDIFVPEEAWAARHTPVNKQVNFGHTDAIVGHMVSSSVVDFNGKLIPDDVPFNSLPEDFDIVVAAVLYKKHPNKELREAVASILPKIANGEAHVSMECFFNDFDYGLISDVGEKSVLPRNEETSWLTKHLLQFGGTGEYNGYTLGRVIKNLTFSGKGIVENPANKRSVIFSEMKKFSNASVKDDAKFISVSKITEKEEKNMSEKVVSQEEYDKVVAKLEELQAGNVSELQEKVNVAEDALAKLQESYEELEDKLAEASEKLEESAKASESHETDLAEKIKELEAAHKELDEIKAKSLKTERIGKLITAGVSEEEAGEITEKWSAASTEQFDEIVSMQKAIVAAKMDNKEEEDMEKKMDKKAEKAKADVDEEDDAEASEVDVEAEAGTTPAVGDDKDEVDTDAIASYLGTLAKQYSK